MLIFGAVGLPLELVRLLPKGRKKSDRAEHVSFDLRGSYFWRHAHYRDFTDVDAKTFELRAGLTYKL